MTERRGDQAIYSRGRVYYIEGVGILFDWGKTVPADDTADYAIGAIFQHIDGAAATNFYVNNGTLAKCSFRAASSAAAAALETALALASTPGGASKVGVFDTLGYWTATTVEAILAELGARILPSGTLGKGPSPLIWDSCPLLDILMNPAKGWAWLEDFIGPNALLAGGSTDVHGWDVTVASTGTYGQSESLIEGALSLAAGAVTAGQGVNVQLKHLPIILAASVTTYFEARVKSNAMSGADLSQIFVGLHETDTAIMAANIYTTGAADNSGVGFYQDSAGTQNKMDTTTQKNDGAADVGADLVTVFDDTDYHTLGVLIDGVTSIKFYADGVLVKTSATAANIPDGITLFPSVVCQADGTVSATLDIDWIRIAQKRARSAAGA